MKIYGAFRYYGYVCTFLVQVEGERAMGDEVGKGIEVVGRCQVHPSALKCFLWQSGATENFSIAKWHNFIYTLCKYTLCLIYHLQSFQMRTALKYKWLLQSY